MTLPTCLTYTGTHWFACFGPPEEPDTRRVRLTAKESALLAVIPVGRAIRREGMMSMRETVVLIEVMGMVERRLKKKEQKR